MDIDATDTSTVKPTTDSVDAPSNIEPTTSISAPADFDMGAINEAVAESEKTAPVIQNSFDVNDISLDNTPTSDAELEKQVSDNPNVSLANGAPLTPSAEPAADPEPKASTEAAFVDGDIIDESASSEDEPKEPNPYENIGKDPLAEDATGTPVAAAAGPTPEKPAEEPSAPLEPVSLDNAITTGPIPKDHKKLIIGIVCGVVLVGIIVALVLVLKKS